MATQAFSLGANFVPKLTETEKQSLKTLARKAMFGGGPDWKKGANLHGALDTADHKTARFYAQQLGWKG